jgi:aryl-alcohol dehydrogenase-like predicted oxidoreductase
MLTRSIGGVQVSAIGLGCMNLSHAYGNPPSREAAVALLHRALELGITHFDTAALYGFGSNEELVGAALKAARARIFLASKCGATGVEGRRVIDGRPETLRRTCLAALARLHTDVIDLYYLHRWDRQVPIEDSVGALADLVRAGHIRAIGLSEVSAATLRRAHAVHPVSAVQSEYSIWTRNPEVAVLAECRRLGVAFVAFSPLGRGFFGGAPYDPLTLVPRDIRRDMPRFQPPHLAVNAALATAIAQLAREVGCTSAQLCLAWLLARGPDILPIPGTTSVAHLEQNFAAAAVRLEPGVVERIDALVNPKTVSGGRYSESAQRDIDTEEI